MSDEQNMTATQVKTKTVSKTAMALTVAFLGISALAAAASTGFTPSQMVNGYACSDSDVAVKNSDGSSMSTYNYVNLNTKGKVSYIIPSSGTIINTKYAVDTCGGAGGKQVMENFCHVGNKKLNTKYFNCPSGTFCSDGACKSLPATTTTINSPTTCNDSDITTQNFDGASMAEEQYFNLSKKGTVSITDLVTGEIALKPDSCAGLYDVSENYCNNVTGKMENAIVKCNSTCSDGTCPVSTGTPQIISINGDVVTGLGSTVNCVDTDISLDNLGGASLAEKSYINPALKGRTYSIDSQSGKIIKAVDSCAGLYDVTENYCNKVTGKMEYATVKCLSECVDGRCPPTGAKIIAVNGSLVTSTIGGLYCTDTDVSVKNLDNSSLTERTYINSRVKGTVNAADAQTGNVTVGEDYCNGLLTVVENYCNVSTGKLEKVMVNCALQCDKGACMDTAGTDTISSVNIN